MFCALEQMQLIERLNTCLGAKKISNRLPFPPDPFRAAQCNDSRRANFLRGGWSRYRASQTGG